MIAGKVAFHDGRSWHPPFYDDDRTLAWLRCKSIQIFHYSEAGSVQAAAGKHCSTRSHDP